jgi:hypothetical protein
LIGDLRHEVVAHLDAVLGADRRLELRAKGEAMNVDDAIATRSSASMRIATRSRGTDRCGSAR